MNSTAWEWHRIAAGDATCTGHAAAAYCGYGHALRDVKLGTVSADLESVPAWR